MNKPWIKQIWEFGLGNMVMMTPGLRELSARLGHRIPIYFQTDGLGQLFADCPFIDTLASPLNYRASYTSRKPERLEGESDYAAWSRILNPGDTRGGAEFEPYVDKCSPPECWKHPKGKAVAIVHGCLANYPPSIASKDVGLKVRQRMVDAVIEAGATPIILGNVSDDQRFWREVHLRVETDLSPLGNTTLRQAVGIMQACDAFIANDTGLYHAGAASGMAGLVLWQGTEFDKNRAPSERLRHSRSPEDHEHDINDFLKATP